MTRSVPLMTNVPFSVISGISPENFLLLDVADGFRAGIGILVVNGQANGDPQTRGAGHAELLALVHVILQLHGHGIAALVAERRHFLVEGSAVVPADVTGLIWILD